MHLVFVDNSVYADYWFFSNKNLKVEFSSFFLEIVDRL